MRSTADRFDAVLSVESVSEAEALGRLTLEAEELCRAMPRSTANSRSAAE